MSTAIPEKFLEDDLKSIQLRSQGCLYQYIEKKKLLDGSIAFYPRVIGERDPENPTHCRWAYNWEEKVRGVWKGRSIGSIPCTAVTMIRSLQQQGAAREDIIAFIKKAKSKKTSPKILDVCKNFDNTKLKPVLADDAPQAVVLFAGGGGIEAGMVNSGIRPVMAVEFDPSKPQLSRAFVLDVAEGIALNHHRNFSEYGCKVIQQTVQEVAQSEFAGFPRRPDYLPDYQTMTTKTPKPQNLQSIFRVLGVGRCLRRQATHFHNRHNRLQQFSGNIPQSTPYTRKDKNSRVTPSCTLQEDQFF